MPPKPRDCLRCNRRFRSFGPGHRLCNMCNGKNVALGPQRNDLKPIQRRTKESEQMRNQRANPDNDPCE